MGAERCDDRRGSLCQNSLGAQRPSQRGLWLPNAWRRPTPDPEEGSGRVLWRSRRSKTTGAETGCWRTSGKSWSYTWGQSCWSNHRLGPGRGCFSCDCRCRGGCETGGGSGASGGRVRLTGNPDCPAGSLAPPCGLSGGGSDGNGTLKKSLCPAGDDKMTSWNPPPQAHTCPPSLFHGPSPCPTLADDRTGWKQVGEAWQSDVLYVAQALPD